MFELFIRTLTQGLIYSLLAYGIYITYKILDFPDLTVDGSFPLGASVTAVLITRGVNAFVTIPIAMLFGAAAGLCTGLIHVKLKVRDLLASIITMTALFSINLQIAGSNLAIIGSETIFTLLPFGGMKLMYRKLIAAALLVIVFKVLLDLYFETKSGFLLRGTGDNENVITTLSVDSGNLKILGLAIANALVALCGAIVCQEQRAFSATMGTGQMIFGLAAVIIGTTLFRRFGFVKGTTAAACGSIIYKFCIQIALSAGLPANLLKLITAVLFLIILIIGNIGRKGGSDT